MSNNYNLGGAVDFTELLGAGFVTAVDGLKPSNDNTLLCALKAVSGADTVANVNINDIIGQKGDAGRYFEHGNYGIMNYLKGMIQELDQRYVPKMLHIRIAAEAWANVINITDKGVLVGVVASATSGAAAVNSYYMRVTMDGILICQPTEAILCKSNDADETNVSFPFHHRFNTSLLIEGYTNAAAHPVDFFVMYTVDH